MITSLNHRAYETALKEIGTREIPGKENNPRIVEYHQATSLKATNDEVFWCSSFVNWCVKQAGGTGTQNAMARSWLLWGQKVDTPEVGDIVIFKRGNDGVSGHVGFVAEKPSKLSLYIKVLGGNQGNSVCVKPYLKINLLGYRRAK